MEEGFLGVRFFEWSFVFCGVNLIFLKKIFRYEDEGPEVGRLGGKKPFRLFGVGDGKFGLKLEKGGIGICFWRIIWSFSNYDFCFLRKIWERFRPPGNFLKKGQRELFLKEILVRNSWVE